MSLTRRGFLGAILAAGVAPAIVKASSIMRVVDRGLILPGDEGFTVTESYGFGYVDPKFFSEREIENALIEIMGMTDDRGLLMAVAPTHLIVPRHMRLAVEQMLATLEPPVYSTLKSYSTPKSV